MVLPSLLLLAVGAPTLAAGLPQPADYALMWWAEGFPGHTPTAPWLRCVQTGRYALALETETLRVPHFGPVAPGLDYAAAALADNAAWRALPAAQLDLTIEADGRVYRARRGAAWSQWDGPRLIESGRFVQRADVTGLEFTADDGTRLNVDARFETIAWPDRLALLLTARPGIRPIPAGEAAFGRLGGGFGLTGANHLEVPPAADLEPARFTLELWAFVPVDYQASRTSPWLACQNGNEWAAGNHGLMLIDGRPRACLNIGGGRENALAVDAPASAAVRLEQWNHLAVSYDGATLRLFVNGQPAGERAIGRPRVPGRGGLAFGRRQDNSGYGYHFRGVLDEIRLYDRALTAEEVKARATTPAQPLPGAPPVRAWSFDAAGQASATRPGEQWHRAALNVALTSAAGRQQGRWELPPGVVWSHPAWHETAVVLFPGSAPEPDETVAVTAAELPAGTPRPVSYDALRGWHAINLDGIVPIVPAGATPNDGVERVRLTLTNPGATERPARLLFEKRAAGIAHRFGAPITGVSAFLLDAAGRPTGLPVQLSKNWHGRPEAGAHAGQWLHAFSQVRLPARSTVELELNLVYGHYGGVAAASHAQLCLIGWGSNQLWDESALGSWGESLCYEPDQVQAQAAVLDVRPVMVRSMNRDQPWSWTHNVGGADFFRYFDAAGRRVYPARMKTAYLRQCPVLTEVLYAGQAADGRLEHQATVSLGRTDDLVRGRYRLRLDVRQPTPFSRFVIFQIGADSYSYTGERRMALGNETGLVREWATQWGGDTSRTAPLECTGRVPWISLHEAVSRAAQGVGAWANRGVVIRAWRARLGGRPAAPWVAERGVKARGADTSTIDVVPPPGVTELQPGDFVEATFEHLIVPQFARDYYGPNEPLRAALTRDENTWRMVHREAVGNDLRVEATVGRVLRLAPLLLQAEQDRAELTIEGGLGYVPITVAGLSRLGRPRFEERQGDGWQLLPGAEVWQTDHDPTTRTWSATVTVKLDTPGDQRVRRVVRMRWDE